jgi:hypothetical protein
VVVGVGLGEQVSNLVVGIERALAERVDDLLETAQGVVTELGRLAGLVGPGGRAPKGVVARLLEALVRIDGLNDTLSGRG